MDPFKTIMFMSFPDPKYSVANVTLWTSQKGYVTFDERSFPSDDITILG